MKLNTSPSNDEVKNEGLYFHPCIRLHGVCRGKLHILFSEMEFSLCRDDISGNGGVAPQILTFDVVCR